jgi:hypothetical protein
VALNIVRGIFAQHVALNVVRGIFAQHVTLNIERGISPTQGVDIERGIFVNTWR